jgi:FMN phosphatase YigB (HAD superfamily)
MRAVLFDLDGTLLDIDIDSFLRTYFAALTETMAGVVDDPERIPHAMDGILRATNKMMEPHPGVTNKTVFVEAFRDSAGIDIERHWDVFDAFYDDVFPTLGTDLGPRAGAHDAWNAALEHGLTVAVATNPIFPARAIEHRLTWAQVDSSQAKVVTTYEDMTASKPHAEYYRQTAQMLGIEPSECLMVGDDAQLDMPAADVGMKTFYVGGDPAAVADYSGDMGDVADLIHRTGRE